jgi:hypothetical protein
MFQDMVSICTSVLLALIYIIEIFIYYYLFSKNKNKIAKETKETIQNVLFFDMESSKQNNHSTTIMNC